MPPVNPSVNIDAISQALLQGQVAPVASAGGTLPATAFEQTGVMPAQPFQQQAPQQQQLTTAEALLEGPTANAGRQLLARNLLEFSNDRARNPLARGIAAFFGAKTLREEGELASADSKRADEAAAKQQVFDNRIAEENLSIARGRASQPNLTALQKNAAAAHPGDRDAQRKFINEVSRKANVQLTNSQETALNKTLGTKFGEKLSQLSDSAGNADLNLALLGQAETELLSGTSTGGPGAQLKRFVTQAASGLDIKLPESFTKEGASLEAIQSGANILVLNELPKLGQKPTDADRDALEKTIQNVGLSTRGNLRIIDIQRQIANRQIEEDGIANNVLLDDSISDKRIATKKAWRANATENPFVFKSNEQIDALIAERTPKGNIVEEISTQSAPQRNMQNLSDAELQQIISGGR